MRYVPQYRILIYVSATKQEITKVGRTTIGIDSDVRDRLMHEQYRRKCKGQRVSFSELVLEAANAAGFAKGPVRIGGGNA